MKTDLQSVHKHPHLIVTSDVWQSISSIIWKELLKKNYVVYFNVFIKYTQHLNKLNASFCKKKKISLKKVVLNLSFYLKPVNYF